MTVPRCCSNVLFYGGLRAKPYWPTVHRRWVKDSAIALRLLKRQFQCGANPQRRLDVQTAAVELD